MYVQCFQTDLYLQARAVRLGEAPLAEKFAPVLLWINSTFRVNALNIELKAEGKEIVASIIVDTDQDWRTIAANRDAPDMLLRFITSNHPALLAGLVGSGRKFRIDTDSFDRVYLEEALEKVETIDLEKIIARFDNIWRINVDAHHFTVFYYTAEQMTTKDANGMSAEVSKAIFDALKKWDKVNIFPANALTVGFNNKENFDTNYGGQWESYYR